MNDGVTALPQKHNYGLQQLFSSAPVHGRLAAGIVPVGPIGGPLAEVFSPRDPAVVVLVLPGGMRLLLLRVGVALLELPG